MYVSEKLAKFMDASDSAAAQRAMDNTVAANVALRMNETGIVKSYLHGDFHPFMVRTQAVLSVLNDEDTHIVTFVPLVACTCRSGQWYSTLQMQLTSP